jgi:hypothetical protein
LKEFAAVPGAAPPMPDHQEPPTTRQMGVIWALLMINVLGIDGVMIVQIPRVILQAVTMGCLVSAFVLALRLNPMVRVRFNVYLVMLTTLTLVAFVSSYRLEAGLGSLFRCFRLAVLVATLWLICQWWPSDLRFVRLHVRVLGAVLASVVLGVLVAPGPAFSGAEGGRLTGVIWPVPPTQVGEYGAVAAGLVVLLWLTHTLDGRGALQIAAPAVACLLLSHTRTALLGFLIALPVAGLTLVLTSARARRAIGLGICLAGFAALALPDVLMDWFNRDQSPDQIADLTGRQKVWDALLARERTTTEQMLGIGLSNKSYDGLPIDSTWLSTYHELGEIGVGVVVLMLASLLIMAFLRPPSVARRCAVFLIVYCIVASYTEVGLGDASPYLLHLALAASLLLAPGATRNESNSSAREQQETTGPSPVP